MMGWVEFFDAAGVNAGFSKLNAAHGRAGRFKLDLADLSQSRSDGYSSQCLRACHSAKSICHAGRYFFLLSTATSHSSGMRCQCVLLRAITVALPVFQTLLPYFQGV
jgi:hypothetical protein